MESFRGEVSEGKKVTSELPFRVTLGWEFAAKQEY